MLGVGDGSPLKEHCTFMTPQIFKSVFVTDKIINSFQLDYCISQSFKNPNLIGINQIRVINPSFIMAENF